MILSICIGAIFSTALWILVAFLVLRLNRTMRSFRNSLINQDEFGKQSILDLKLWEILMFLLFMASLTAGAFAASAMSHPSQVLRDALIATIFGLLVWTLVFSPMLKRAGFALLISPRWIPMVICTLFFTTTGFLVFVNGTKHQKEVEVTAKIVKVGRVKRNLIRNLFLGDDGRLPREVHLWYVQPFDFEAPMNDAGEVRLIGRIDESRIPEAQTSGLPLKIKLGRLGYDYSTSPYSLSGFHF